MGNSIHPLFFVRKTSSNAKGKVAIYLRITINGFRFDTGIGRLLAFEERTREQEIREAAEKAQAERKRNIQYSAIGIAIITILILFPLFSFSVMANSGWIKFLSIVALLIVFEFINLLVHPYLMELTGDSPILMLLALAAIAALLVSLHHKIEVWVTAKMI